MNGVYFVVYIFQYGKVTFKKSFYGLAADRQDYCFTKYYSFFIFYINFLKFIFEP